MGAWGYDIFKNDRNLDVKDTFVSYLIESEDKDQFKAFEKTLKVYDDSLDDIDVIMPLAYLSIAFHSLTKDLKQKTINVINEEIRRGLSSWDEPSEREKSLVGFKMFIETIETVR